MKISLINLFFSDRDESTDARVRQTRPPALLHELQQSEGMEEFSLALSISRYAPSLSPALVWVLLEKYEKEMMPLLATHPALDEELVSILLNYKAEYIRRSSTPQDEAGNLLLLLSILARRSLLPPLPPQYREVGRLMLSSDPGPEASQGALRDLLGFLKDSASRGASIEHISAGAAALFREADNRSTDPWIDSNRDVAGQALVSHPLTEVSAVLTLFERDDNAGLASGVAGAIMNDRKDYLESKEILNHLLPYISSWEVARALCRSPDAVFFQPAMKQALRYDHILKRAVFLDPELLPETIGSLLPEAVAVMLSHPDSNVRLKGVRASAHLRESLSAPDLSSEDRAIQRR